MARAAAAAPARSRPRPRSYLAWTQQHFPVGGPESQLLETLEKCTRTLLPLDRYKTDVRYLRVWVQYVRAPAAPTCPQRSRAAADAGGLLQRAQGDLRLHGGALLAVDSRAVRPMHAHVCCAQHHGIGQDFALFYEARAAFLELRNNAVLASAVYEKGISRCAPRQFSPWLRWSNSHVARQASAAAAAAQDQVRKLRVTYGAHSGALALFALHAGPTSRCRGRRGGWSARARTRRTAS